MILSLCLLITAPESQDPAWLMREALALSGAPAPRWQSLLTALETLQPDAQRSAVKALFQTLARAPAAPVEVRCMSALGLALGGVPLQQVADCSGGDLGVLVALEAVALGAGGPARAAYVAQAAKSEDVRVRAFAARAAVFALPDARAAAVVRQALRSGDSVTVALVAEAFVTVSEPLVEAKRPRAWTNELVRAAEREEVDQEASRLVRDAVAMLDADKAEEIDVAPATQPVQKGSARTVTSRVAGVRFVVGRDGRVAPLAAGALLAVGATSQSPR